MKNTVTSEKSSLAPPAAGHVETVERRREERYPVTAAITAVDPGTGAHIEARTSDINSHGCYVDSMNSFPAGSSLRIRLTKDGRSFDTRANVTYCQAGVGMGLEFTAVDPKQLDVIRAWLTEVGGDSETSQQGPDEIVRASASGNSKTEEHFALEELLVVLMRKDILTEEEGEPILRRLLR